MSCNHTNYHRVCNDCGQAIETKEIPKARIKKTQEELDQLTVINRMQIPPLNQFEKDFVTSTYPYFEWTPKQQSVHQRIWDRLIGIGVVEKKQTPVIKSPPIGDKLDDILF